ncbi:hypothetical protein KIPB_003823, partial [Kipferlia bialata]
AYISQDMPVFASYASGEDVSLHKHPYKVARALIRALEDDSEAVRETAAQGLLTCTETTSTADYQQHCTDLFPFLLNLIMKREGPQDLFPFLLNLIMKREGPQAEDVHTENCEEVRLLIVKLLRKTLIRMKGHPQIGHSDLADNVIVPLCVHQLVSDRNPAAKMCPSVCTSWCQTETQLLRSSGPDSCSNIYPNVYYWTKNAEQYNMDEGVDTMCCPKLSGTQATILAEALKLNMSHNKWNVRKPSLVAISRLALIPKFEGVVELNNDLMKYTKDSSSKVRTALYDTSLLWLRKQVDRKSYAGNFSAGALAGMCDPLESISVYVHSELVDVGTQWEKDFGEDLRDSLATREVSNLPPVTNWQVYLSESGVCPFPLGAKLDDEGHPLSVSVSDKGERSPVARLGVGLRDILQRGAGAIVRVCVGEMDAVDDVSRNRSSSTLALILVATERFAQKHAPAVLKVARESMHRHVREAGIPYETDPMFRRDGPLAVLASLCHPSALTDGFVRPLRTPLSPMDLAAHLSLLSLCLQTRDRVAKAGCVYEEGWDVTEEWLCACMRAVTAPLVLHCKDKHVLEALTKTLAAANALANTKGWMGIKGVADKGAAEREREGEGETAKVSEEASPLSNLLAWGELYVAARTPAQSHSVKRGQGKSMKAVPSGAPVYASDHALVTFLPRLLSSDPDVTETQDEGASSEKERRELSLSMAGCLLRDHSHRERGGEREGERESVSSTLLTAIHTLGAIPEGQVTPIVPTLLGSLLSHPCLLHTLSVASKEVEGERETETITPLALLKALLPMCAYRPGRLCAPLRAVAIQGCCDIITRDASNTTPTLSHEILSPMAPMVCTGLIADAGAVRSAAVNLSHTLPLDSEICVALLRRLGDDPDTKIAEIAVEAAIRHLPSLSPSCDSSLVGTLCAHLDFDQGRIAALCEQCLSCPALPEEVAKDWRAECHRILKSRTVGREGSERLDRILKTLDTRLPETETGTERETETETETEIA